MKRREVLVSATGVAAAWAPPLRAQLRDRRHRIGFLGLDSEAHHAPRLNALRAGLRERGYIEGQNLVIEYRWADGAYGRVPALVRELLDLNIAILVTHGSAGAVAAKRATSTVPVVLTAVGEIVDAGLVASIAGPGGNITGLSVFASELAAKRLELLAEAVPNLRAAGLVYNGGTASYRATVREAQATAEKLDIALSTFDVRQPIQLATVFAEMGERRIGAAIIHDDTMLNEHARTISDLANAHRIPTSGLPDFARAGCLIAYGINYPDMAYRAATFIDRILKGANPAELPVEQPTKFIIVVNLNAAKQLGLALPPSLLARADELIE